MKKSILAIIYISLIYGLALQASSNNEMVIDKTTEVKVSNKKNELTVEMCKKQLGTDNYNFIKEVYNDENIVIEKCKEALMSK